MIKIHDKPISDFAEHRDRLRREFYWEWAEAIENLKMEGVALNLHRVKQIAFEAHMAIVERLEVLYRPEWVMDEYVAACDHEWSSGKYGVPGCVKCGVSKPDPYQFAADLYNLAAGPDKPQKSLEESYPPKQAKGPAVNWWLKDEPANLPPKRIGPPIQGESHCTACGYHVCSCAQIAAAKADLERPIVTVDNRNIDELHGPDILRMLWPER